VLKPGGATDGLIHTGRENGFSILTPAITWPELRSSLRSRAAPALRAAARISASQNPMPASSSIRNAAEISAGVVSLRSSARCCVHREEWIPGLIEAGIEWTGSD
jgi:hypothetical protein